MVLGKSSIELVGMSQKIGDALMFSSVPENYYKTFGKKLIHKENHWSLVDNPYIDRETDAEFKINPHHFLNEFDQTNTKTFKGIIERINFAFGAKIFERGPRLYLDKKPPASYNVLVIHLDGLTQNFHTPKNILETIKNKYSNFNVKIVGAERRTDVFPFICPNDKKELINIISEANIFIGVNSGPLHIANCFDYIRKKVLMNNPEEELNRFLPSLSTNCAGDIWIDYNLEYYNFFEYDVGVTRSYLKI